MKLNIIITNLGTAIFAGIVCYALFHAPPQPSESSRSSILAHVPSQPIQKSEPPKVRISRFTWTDLDKGESFQEWVIGLHRFGMDTDYIRALVPLKQQRLLAAKSQQPYYQRPAESLAAAQRRAQLEADELLANLDPAPKATDRQLKFLSTERRTKILANLKSVDAELRALEHKNANGVWESDDWDRFEAAKRQRQNALFEQFTPEEKRQWITQESPEAGELRARYIDLSKDQFDQVAQAKYEANQALAAQKLTDEERNRINATLELRLKGVLGEEGFQQFKRAEEPYYGAYWSLGEKLGLDAKAVNVAFDWQNYVQQADATLRQQGLPDEEVEARMKPLADQAKAALQQLLGEEAFRRFSDMPQDMFLSAYEPLTNE